MGSKEPWSVSEQSLFYLPWSQGVLQVALKNPSLWSPVLTCLFKFFHSFIHLFIHPSTKPQLTSSSMPGSGWVPGIPEYSDTAPDLTALSPQGQTDQSHAIPTQDLEGMGWSGMASWRSWIPSRCLKDKSKEGPTLLWAGQGKAGSGKERRLFSSGDIWAVSWMTNSGQRYRQCLPAAGIAHAKAQIWESP